MERKLKKTAKKKFPKNKKRQAKYVYGTLRKTNWKPKTQREKKNTRRNT